MIIAYLQLRHSRRDIDRSVAREGSPGESRNTSSVGQPSGRRASGGHRFGRGFAVDWSDYLYSTCLAWFALGVVVLGVVAAQGESFDIGFKISSPLVIFSGLGWQLWMRYDEWRSPGGTRSQRNTEALSLLSVALITLACLGLFPIVIFL